MALGSPTSNGTIACPFFSPSRPRGFCLTARPYSRHQDNTRWSKDEATADGVSSFQSRLRRHLCVDNKVKSSRNSSELHEFFAKTPICMSIPHNTTQYHTVPHAWVGNSMNPTRGASWPSRSPLTKTALDLSADELGAATLGGGERVHLVPLSYRAPRRCSSKYHHCWPCWTKQSLESEHLSSPKDCVLCRYTIPIVQCCFVFPAKSPIRTGNAIARYITSFCPRNSASPDNKAYAVVPAGRAYSRSVGLKHSTRFGAYHPIITSNMSNNAERRVLRETSDTTPATPTSSLPLRDTFPLQFEGTLFATVDVDVLRGDGKPCDLSNIASLLTLDNDIHPIFAKSQWCILAKYCNVSRLPSRSPSTISDQEYDGLTPSLRLATLFLTTPSLMHYWHAVLVNVLQEILSSDIPLDQRDMVRRSVVGIPKIWAEPPCYRQEDLQEAKARAKDGM